MVKLKYVIYKIIKSSKKILMVWIISHFATVNIIAQSDITNKYGLNVVNNVKILQTEIANDSNKKMVDIKESHTIFDY